MKIKSCAEFTGINTGIKWDFQQKTSSLVEGLRNTNPKRKLGGREAQRAFSHLPNAEKGMKIKSCAEFTGINTRIKWVLLPCVTLQREFPHAAISFCPLHHTARSWQPSAVPQGLLPEIPRVLNQLLLGLPAQPCLILPFQPQARNPAPFPPN